jgi:glyceraldehyde 3-phosphate dehydrogenase
MTLRVAINGLGRIGRCVLRAVIEENRDDIEIVAINGPAPIETHVHLLRYDSVHGPFRQAKAVDGTHIDCGRGPIPLFRERDPLNLPWKELDVDVVLECTGKFKDRASAGLHLQAGAKRVLISAPSSDCDRTIVHGVNNEDLTADDRIVSVGSCTTNCLAPVVKVLDEAIGIERGFMTTIHAYTSDQNLLDNSHSDLRRARAACLSMVPTSTGAAKALSLVLPQMEGRLDGVSVRVPTPNVSMVDLTFTAGKETSVEAINNAIKEASLGALKGVIAYHDEPLVSIDHTHAPQSALFDATGTKVVGGTFCRVAAWYDNEWGFSCRMLDVAVDVARLIKV